MAKFRKKTASPSQSSESIEDVSVAQPGFQSPSESDSDVVAPSPSAGDAKAGAGAARDRIAMRAYELYLARGRGEGAAMEDWLRAERELAPSRPAKGESER